MDVVVVSKEEQYVLLEAPCPVEVNTERKEKPSCVWSSGSETSSSLFGTVVIESTDPSSAETPSATAHDASLLADVHHGVQEYVSGALDTLERRLEVVLDSISDELTSEVIRERQHLLLMQEKVDMQGQTLQREFTELNKKMTQESTLRSMVQQKYREQNDALGASLQSISKEIAELKRVVNRLETPWMYRALHNMLFLFQQCSGNTCSYQRLQSGDGEV